MSLGVLAVQGLGMNFLRAAAAEMFRGADGQQPGGPLSGELGSTVVERRAANHRSAANRTCPGQARPVSAGSTRVKELGGVVAG